MANALYGKGREAILGAEIDWVGTEMRIIIVDATDYTLSIDVEWECRGAPYEVC